MVRQGLLEEVQALLAAGLPPTATAWQAIGYKQFLAAADGRCTVTEAIEEVKLRSPAVRQAAADVAAAQPGHSLDPVGRGAEFSPGPAKCDRISHRSWLTISPGADGHVVRQQRKGADDMQKNNNLQEIFLTKGPQARAFP